MLGMSGSYLQEKLWKGCPGSGGSKCKGPEVGGLLGVFVARAGKAREEEVCDTMRLERSRGQITQGLTGITEEVRV